MTAHVAARSPASVSSAPPPAAPFDSAEHLHDDKFHILLAASGSVATIKLPAIARALSVTIPNLSIRIVTTQSATQFLQGQSEEQPTLQSLLNDIDAVDAVYSDEDEWSVPWTRGAKILHIELRRWADVLVVAPLSANTMAKMVGGICDNLLLSTIRAWDTTGILDVPHQVTIHQDEGSWPVRVTYPSERRKKIIVVAPAMNTAMWAHPVTQMHTKVLEENWGVQNGGWIEVLRPIEKTLACGDVGGGAMCSWEKIVERVIELHVASS